MNYYLIAGEASGDLHASHLIASLLKQDKEAQFRFFGGENMLRAAGDHGTMVTHYRDLAYMGFIPVLLHLPTILRGMKLCKQDIMAWKPDVVIFVDYAGFNLSIAKYLRKNSSIPLYYYIAPKIWAWKEHRIKNFKRDIDEMFSILPFEKDFFENKHQYPIHYVGNPTADEVRNYLASHNITATTANEPTEATSPNASKPIIALLAGSRRQEIKDNLPSMIEATRPFARNYRLVIAGAPSIEPEYYGPFIEGKNFVELQRFRDDSTYALLSKATCALVTSGTATLETACFRVPQVVCYKTPVAKLTRWAFNHIIKCKYISLVNLIADKEVVPELFADRFSVEDIRKELERIMPGFEGRRQQLADYDIIHQRLGSECAPDNAARIILQKLSS